MDEMYSGDDLPTYDELPAAPGAPPFSSWGLWGAHDQLGCLNLLSDAARRRAAASVEQGRVISLNASLQVFDTPLFGRPEMQHEITELDRGRVRDEILSAFNTQCSTQWDGLRHARSVYGFYNDLPEEELSISTWAETGIVGRGVLLDVEAYRAQDGRPLDYRTSDPITVEDLVEAAARQSLVIEPGDILIIHTGWLDWARSTSPGGFPADFSTPGLRPGRDMLRFLWNLHVAAVGSDTPAVEVWPPAALTSSEQRRAARSDPQALAEIFMHADLLALLGLPLGELWLTQELAAACRDCERSDFLLASAPLSIPGGVASPINALAIL